MNHTVYALRGTDTNWTIVRREYGRWVVVASGILYYDWHSMTGQATDLRSQIRRLNGEKARLEQLKAEVEGSEKQRVVLQQRIGIIEELQRNRTGGHRPKSALTPVPAVPREIGLTPVPHQFPGRNNNAPGFRPTGENPHHWQPRDNGFCHSAGMVAQYPV